MALLENFEKQGNYLFKHRGTIPLLIVIPGLVITYYSGSGINSSHHKWHITFEIACLFIALLGFFIRAVTVGYTPKGTSGRNTDQQVADTLNTTGMYSIVRHPLYFGNFLMWLGICLRTSNLCFTVLVCFFFWIYYERIMLAEEQFIRKKYGVTYFHWANKTPTFLPNFSLWKASTLDLSLKKILRQEKNGFLVIFLIFFVLEIASQRSIDTVLSTELHWTVFLSFSILSYIILKYLKYNTKLLDEAR